MLFMCAGEAAGLSFRRLERSERVCGDRARTRPLLLLLSSGSEMRYVAAYLLAVLGGNEAPASKDIKKILDSVGIEADDERLNKVISELKGKNVGDVIAAGNAKLASVPSGGAVAVSAAGAAAPAAGAAAAATEDKKEEKKDESEESDDDMGFGLFD
ncbi:ribosomal protein, large P2, like isoform X1 [Leucoraja erinacea]|uniref:ribosomal protein, large P2, like isoform X1 n=1 Tax=Leucoraja erinaceus TaxID=7782 RepID=UPI002458B398|nr:ribosomal protein, large P2, like isoform X1 [Leucoraja erinacea]